MPDRYKSLKIMTLFLVILLVGESFLYYQDIEKLEERNNTINTLVELLEDQNEKISRLEISITRLEQNLSRTEDLLKNETLTRQNLEDEIINLTMVAKGDYFVLAVDETDRGHIIPLEVIIKEGSGNLFLNVANVLVDETLQSSAQTAVKVAREVSRTNLYDKDVLIKINAPVQQQNILISGGSAGAAVTLAAISAMMGSELRNDVMITGTINEDHTIGRIGGARAKGLAAKEKGAILFLVPAGQKSEVGAIGIEVQEVRTIEDAVKRAISG